MPDEVFEADDFETPEFMLGERQRPAVKDRRGHSFFIVDDAIIDKYGLMIGPYGLALYVALCRHANKQGQCYPSWRSLAEETGMSERKARYASTTLIEHGLLEVEERVTPNGRRTSNLFILQRVKVG